MAIQKSEYPMGCLIRKLEETVFDAKASIIAAIGAIDHRINWLTEVEIKNDSTFGGKFARRIERHQKIKELLITGPDWWPSDNSSLVTSDAEPIIKILAAVDLIDYLIAQVALEDDLDELTMDESLKELDIIKYGILYGAQDEEAFEKASQS